uniref:Pescadillo homolog n=1 Tax=Macrostomum lignano TaxID=282301 RepID=A0A1I8HNE6_9PLAT
MELNAQKMPLDQQELQECHRLNSQGNNNAQGSALIQEDQQPPANNSAAAGNDEAAAKAARKQAFLDKKLNDPRNLRMFTSDNNLLGPYWEHVTAADQRETFPPRDESGNLTSDERVQHKFAVELGQNIAKWHQQNKPVVCEYLLFLKDENLNLLKPQYSAIIKKCSRKSKCVILITNRILNKQVGKFKWIKYLIVQIQGPDYTMVKICNTMLERWFPEYRQRLVYNKQRFKFGIYTTENSVDNMELYFPFQRSNKCSINYGDMNCDTPYGATEQRTVLDSSWKQNNRLFAAGNLLPSNGPVKTAQAYVYAFHPLGTQDKFLFRSQFGVQEPPRNFTARSDIGYPNSSVCGPDFPGHPVCYDKVDSAAAATSDDVEEDETQEQEQEEEIMDASYFILSDKEMKAKFKLKKMKLIMNRRREWIFGDKQLGVPFPQVLLPTTSITESKAGSSKDDAKSKKGKKKIKPDAIIKNIRFINEDNIYLEYCFEKEHLKRNPISPYPRSLVPGRELAERINVTKIYIGPIKYDFVKDRREELNQRFQLLGQAIAEIPATSPVTEKAAKPKASGTKRPKKSGQAGLEKAVPIVSFNEFKEKLVQDAQVAGANPDDLLGKDRISAKNVDRVVPGWRSMVGREDSIFEEVKTRLNVFKSLKDKYSNVKGFFNPLFDPYEDIPTTEAKARVQPKVKRQIVKGINLSERNPQKVATVLDELMDVFKKEESQPARQATETSYGVSNEQWESTNGLLFS